MHQHLARTVTAAVLLGASAFVTMPAQAAPADPSSPTVFAHRGASTEAPENTLAAVRRAHEQHIKWIENDVQRTKDGALVVIHDTTLSRTTDVEQVFPDRSPGASPTSPSPRSAGSTPAAGSLPASAASASRRCRST